MGELSGEKWNELPSDLLAVYRRWHESTTYDSELTGWMAGGMSDALVAVASQFEADVLARQAVLKFLKGDGAREARRMRRALNRSPREFREAHLVELIGDPIMLGSWWMIQMRIAGGDRSTVRPLVELRHSDGLPKACGIVFESVLGAWNPTLLHRPESMTAGAYLRLLLGDRLDHGEPLDRWAVEHGVTATVEWVPDGDGGLARNPLALAKGDGSHQLLVHRGRGHGDLNVRNVLLRAEDPRGFKLIDFGDFAEDAPLARDPAHLLLSLAREWLRALADDPEARHHLKAAIVTPHNPDVPSVFGFKAVSAAFHEAGQSWADSNDHGEHWRPQALLSLIGCALVFVGRKRLPDDVRQWFFDMSVYAAREYSRLTRDVDVPPFRPAAKAPVVGVPRSRGEIDAVLSRQLHFMQRTMGNQDGLVGAALQLLDEEERFVRLAPCRVRASTPGSAVIVVSDRYVRTAELDTKFRASGVTRIAHGDIRQLHLSLDRRLGLIDTADVRIATDSIELLVRGLLRDQAQSLVSALEELTGVRRRQLAENPAAAWRDLVEALRATRFTARTSGDLAADTEFLRMALREERPPYPKEPMRVEELVGRLEEILSEAAMYATADQVRRACASAELFRRWLLDLLSEARP
ncbi:hypothetical protein [Nonomuraea harbinensis]|uniref:Protein kinase domain-containing protein n=1 Tax=Nonomuraea harbinensis TaxID=1286938 RepID=A0ABW1BZX7_9ACTN|nr:hypothetical protein [Nonomuraea harbinensis]